MKPVNTKPVKATEPRNLVLLFDGTSNQISGDRTNVVRLFGALKKDERQLVFYHPGVGSLGRSRGYITKLGQDVNEAIGLAFGVGLDDNVFEGYRFLVNNCRSDDSIHLFGFSRGAYTARVLAGFLKAFGLMSGGNLHLLPYVWQAYDTLSKAPKGTLEEQAFMPLRHYGRMLSPRRAVPVRFMGLFDTVSSVIWRNGRPTTRQHWGTDENHMVSVVRHAVAIDERRSLFLPYLWPKDQDFFPIPFRNRAKVEPLDDAEARIMGASDQEETVADGDWRKTQTKQDCAELWFAGHHGDVGGGWPEQDSGLAKVPLIWMVEEAKKVGLRFIPQQIDVNIMGLRPGRDGKEYSKPCATAEMNDPMKLRWRVTEFLPQRRTEVSWGDGATGSWHFPLGKPRKLPANAVFHPSVNERLQGTVGYDPRNLPPTRPLPTS